MGRDAMRRWLPRTRCGLLMATVLALMMSVICPPAWSFPADSHEALIRAAEIVILHDQNRTNNPRWADKRIMGLEALRASNPGASAATLAAAYADEISVIDAMEFSPEGRLGEILHPRLEKLTDSELEHLIKLYSDPAMFKFLQTQRDDLGDKDGNQADFSEARELVAKARQVVLQHGLNAPVPDSQLTAASIMKARAMSAAAHP
jgi:hypothetical protein